MLHPATWLRGLLETFAKDERVGVHVVRNLYWGERIGSARYRRAPIRSGRSGNRLRIEGE
jgi:hypothetical protein